METGCADRVLVRPIGYADILDGPDAEQLLAEYSAECSIPQIGTPDPQRAIYQAMEESGLMRAFGLFRDEAMIGFAILLLFVLPHYGKKIANVESLFIAKTHRTRGVGRLLMQEAESFATRMECVAVLYNARAGTRLERLLSLSPNYERTNSVFLRSLA